MAKKIDSIKKIATLGKRELRYTNIDNELKFDIREWKSDDKYGDGVRFTIDELNQLSDGSNTIGNKQLVFYKDEWCLQLELNGRTYTRPFATKDEMDVLKKILEKVKTTTELLAYKVEESTEKEEENTSTKTVKEKKEPKKIIEFPKPKPEIDKLVTDGNATYEECEEKLNKEREVFTDSDSQYVIDGLLELCKVDSDFRNNVMREDKNYQGALQYMMEMAKQGYAYKFNGGAMMDRDMGLGFSIDYFNSKPKPKPEPKTKSTKKTTKKKGA